MGNASPKRDYYSLDEYQALVRDARPGERYEYVAGRIIKCEEYTTDNHNQIVLNWYQLLADVYYPNDCRVYTENVRICSRIIPVCVLIAFFLVTLETTYRPLVV